MPRHWCRFDAAKAMAPSREPAHRPVILKSMAGAVEPLVAWTLLSFVVVSVTNEPPLPPLLVFGDDWGRRVSTVQHIVRRLIGTRPIAWVNGINHRAPRLTLYDMRRAVEKLSAMRRQDRPSSAGDPEASDNGPRPDLIIGPRVLPWHQFRSVQSLNGRWLAHDIGRAVHATFHGSAPIVVSSTPVAAYAMAHLRHRAIVYFCLDEYAAMDGVDPGIVVPAERRMLQIADAVLVTASTMLNSKRPVHGRVHHVPQGVNYDHFASPGPVDPDVARLPRPVLGFSGTIEPRLDVPILAGLADRFPTGSIVLVGEQRMSIGDLAERSNVCVLPRRSYADLPAVLRGFDVGLVPYTLSDWTRAVDPLKLLEYLAAGLPVVSTPLPEVVRHGHIIEIGGETPEAFGLAAGRALDPHQRLDRAARQRYAAQHTWEVRAEQVSHLLEELASVMSPQQADSP